MQEKYAGSNLLLPNLASNPAEPLSQPLIEQFVSAPLPRDYGAPLVDDWDCLRVSTCVWATNHQVDIVDFAPLDPSDRRSMERSECRP